jgi:hypothetical protein
MQPCGTISNSLHQQPQHAHDRAQILFLFYLKIIINLLPASSENKIYISSQKALKVAAANEGEVKPS